MNKKYTILVFWVFAVFSFLVTRLVNLKIIPIFTDEAIYAYWAQIALNDPENRFISMIDGKQPLFIWFASISQFFIKDPLVATRFVSAFAGFFSMIGIFVLARLLFNKNVAITSTLLYIFIPFSLFYDRMGLYDSLLTSLGIWATFLAVKMVKNPRLDLALLNGFTIGLATITKSSGFFFLYLLPFSLILYKFKKHAITTIAKWIGLTILSAFIAQLIYNLLRLSPYFYLISRKNMEFIRPVKVVIDAPFSHFLTNANAIYTWLSTYLTIPLFALFTLGLMLGIAIVRNRKIIYLAVIILVPVCTMLFFNQVLYPRFLLFFFPYMLITIAYALDLLRKRFNRYSNIVILTFLFISIYPLIISIKLLIKPTDAKIPTADSEQYLNSWPAGYGITEVVAFIKKESENGHVYVGTQGTFGLFPFSLNIYFYGNSNVHIYSYWPVNPSQLPQEIMDFSKNSKTYFIFNEEQKEIVNSKLKLVVTYKKGIGVSYLRFYEVKAQ